jgi:putative ABC transport system substrate-binding protein
LEAFKQGLRGYGYVEGKNLILEARYADGKVDRLASLAAELVMLRVQIIVTTDTPATLAARQAAPTIPIVFTTAADPVGSGLVSSLAHPGGNITGLSNMAGDLSSKHVELLVAVVPGLSHVAVLTNSANLAHRSILNGVQGACERAGITCLPFEADTPSKIDSAFASMARNRAQAVIIALDTFFSQRRRQIAELALKYSIPTIAANPDYVDAEPPMLMSYGQNIADHWRRAASYCDKILKGAKPSDLPVEQSETLSLAINLRAARALGVTIPYSILVRADKVIE